MAYTEEQRNNLMNQFIKDNKTSQGLLQLPNELQPQGSLEHNNPYVLYNGVFMEKNSYQNIADPTQGGTMQRSGGTDQAPLYQPITPVTQDSLGQGKVSAASLPQQPQQETNSIIGRMLGPKEYGGLARDNKLTGVSSDSAAWQKVFTKDGNGNIYLRPPVAPAATPIENVSPTGNTSTPNFQSPTAPATMQSFFAETQSYADQTRQAVQQSYQQQQDDAQKRQDAAAEQMKGALAGEKGIADANYQKITDALAVQKQRIDDNYNANQALIGEMDTLLTQGNALIQQQQNTTSLGAIKDPRIAKTMSDVTARTGVIQAVLAARNGQIGVAESALSSTVSALNAATQDQLNHYKALENYYSGKETSASNDVKTFINAKIGILENDMKQAETNANNLRNAMTNPDTALAYAEAGVTLNDPPSVIAQKMGTYGYSKELTDLSNTMAKGGYSYLAPGQNLPKGMVLEPQTDTKGVVHNYYKPTTTAQPTASIQEYNFAVQNGYKGSFTQYQNEDANRKRVNNTSITYNQSQDAKQKDDIGKLGTWLGDKIGKDQFVSPDDYKTAKIAWTKDGYPAADFDKTFSNYVNPAIENQYGVTFKLPVSNTLQ